MHDFLASRRARISPAQAGMPTYGEKRRVLGLRREEVASLAGMSFDYYARLERGNLSGVSDSAEATGSLERHRAYPCLGARRDLAARRRTRLNPPLFLTGYRAGNFREA